MRPVMLNDPLPPNNTESHFMYMKNILLGEA